MRLKFSPSRTPIKHLHRGIFRAYDIRGITATELTADVVHDIGLAIGTELQSRNLNQIIIGRDGRLSGIELQQALAEGLLATGCDVYQIGMVPTPVLYYATETFGISSGVMITGSHNPKEYNGLKIVIDGHTLTEQAIMNLYQTIVSRKFASGHGQLFNHDIKDNYLRTIESDINLRRQLKIVVDAGNGVAGELAPRLYRNLGVQVIPMYCRIDGNFPNHHPDPSQPKNLKKLIERVQAEKADLGLAFDGDGDRLGVITQNGEIIWPDRQLMLFARELLKKRPGETIIYDVKCSANVKRVIEQYQGNPLMYKTGHSLIKAKMKEINAALAGEMSGHIFFNDRWYGFDDGLYTGARLLEILSHYSEDSTQLFASIPNSICTPEIQVPVKDSDKFNIIETLQQEADFKDSELILIDGLRVEFDYGWALVRASNTTANLILRFEADSTTRITELQNQILSFIQKHFPQIELPAIEDLSHD